MFDSSVEESVSDETSTRLNRFAAVVLYYRRGREVRETIVDLLSQNPPPAEIVLVDNASGDGVVEALADDFDSVRALVLPTNRGYAGGMNAGRAAIIGDYDFVLFATHEVRTNDRGLVGGLLAACEQTNAVIAGPRLELGADGAPWSFGGIVRKSGDVAHSLDAPQGAETSWTVDWVDGCCLLIDTGEFDAAGGFDERFFLYWEDAEICLRVSAKSQRPVICIDRTLAQDTGTAPIYWRTRNRILLWRLHRRRMLTALAVGDALARVALKDQCGVTPAGRRRALERLRAVRDAIRVDDAPMVGGLPRLAIANSLPRALAHYEAELRYVLRGHRATLRKRAFDAERPAGRHRVEHLLRALLGAVRQYTSRGTTAVLVVWPTWGYLEPLLWRRWAKSHRVDIVVHDVRPLRPQVGHSALAHRLFARVLRSRPLMRIICHTEAAASELVALTGVRAVVVPHPVMPSPELGAAGTDDALPAIRVMGQYKAERDLAPLHTIARAFPISQLEIVGRGWPEVKGWRVRNDFVSEERFSQLIRGSKGIVMPYRHYYQSGVMVRAFEEGCGVIGLPHPQLTELYGDDWVGVVRDGDWIAAVTRVLQSSSGDIRSRRDERIAEVAVRWRGAFE